MWHDSFICDMTHSCHWNDAPFSSLLCASSSLCVSRTPAVCSQAVTHQHNTKVVFAGLFCNKYTSLLPLKWCSFLFPSLCVSRTPAVCSQAVTHQHNCASRHPDAQYGKDPWSRSLRYFFFRIHRSLFVYTSLFYRLLFVTARRLYRSFLVYMGLFAV